MRVKFDNAFDNYYMREITKNLHHYAKVEGIDIDDDTLLVEVHGGNNYNTPSKMTAIGLNDELRDKMQMVIGKYANEISRVG